MTHESSHALDPLASIAQVYSGLPIAKLDHILFDLCESLREVSLRILAMRGEC